MYSIHVWWKIHLNKNAESRNYLNPLCQPRISLIMNKVQSETIMREDLWRPLPYQVISSSILSSPLDRYFVIHTMQVHTYVWTGWGIYKKSFIIMSKLWIHSIVLSNYSKGNTFSQLKNISRDSYSIWQKQELMESTLNKVALNSILNSYQIQMVNSKLRKFEIFDVE